MTLAVPLFPTSYWRHAKHLILQVSFFSLYRQGGKTDSAMSGMELSFSKDATDKS